MDSSTSTFALRASNAATSGLSITSGILFVMHRHLHKHSPFRIFAFSSIATIVTLVGVGWVSGMGALAVILILIAVEISFSFDNAIINAHVLAKLSPFWQKIFLTVGMLIAVLGMRVV